MSDAAFEITWTGFPAAPPIDHIKVRAKRNAAAPSTWTHVATGLAANSRLVVSPAPTAGSVFEFQPIGCDAGGKPVAFGSVSRAMALSAGQNFTAAYQAWQATYPTAGQPGEDSDGDGLSNLLEFASGFDPLDETVPASALTDVTNRFSFRYTRQSGRFVTWRCEGSTDLRSWSELLPVAECTEQVISSQAGSEVIEVTAPPPAGTPPWFLRLRVSPVP